MDIMTEFGLFFIIFIVLIIGGLSYSAITNYVDTMDESLCEPKMVFENGTKLCK